MQATAIEKRRKTSYNKTRTRTLWITVSVCSLIIIVGTILIASTDGMDWLLR
jgi:uncharacterized membrane protein